MNLGNIHNRSTVKAYFQTNAVPTQAQFEDLINSQLNQFDDGIVKQAGRPLSLRPDVDDSTCQGILNLYETFSNTEPSWRLQLKDSNSDRSGLNIAAADGASKLFIDSSGKVGIGTTSPSQQLEVDGDVKINGQLTVNNNAGVTYGIGALVNNGTINMAIIFHSIARLGDYGFNNDTDRSYIIFPGYKLTVWWDADYAGESIEFDNTDYAMPRQFNLGAHSDSRATSCKLYYRNEEITQPAPPEILNYPSQQ